MDDWRDEPATDRQRDYARDLGATIPSKATKGEASAIIDKAIAKADKGPHTDDQKERAIKLGINLPNRSSRGEAESILRAAQRKVWEEEQAERTRKIERIYGSSNDPPPDFIYPRNLQPSKNLKQSFLKRFSSKSPLHTPCHAKPGTFDPAYFIDAKTRKFCFPKYKHDSKNYLVAIKDTTSYRQELWTDMELTSQERAEYTLRDFENDRPYFELEVESFEKFFCKPNNPHLKELKPIREDTLIVEELIEALHEGEFLFLDADTETLLVKHGYVFARDIVTGEERINILRDLTVASLKNIARPHKIKLGGKKAELLQRIIDSGVEFELDTAYVASPKLMSWYEDLITAYIREIRKNLERFHPLYHGDVWSEASSDSLDAVEIRLERIRRSKYWLAMMD